METRDEVHTTLKNVSRILSKVSFKSEMQAFSYVYVKNGIANICDKKFAMRFAVDAPDGRYNINWEGGLSPAAYDVTLGCFTPFDLEMVRPPFEAMQPFCVIDNPDPKTSVLTEFFPIIQAATMKKETIYIDKRGMGLKRTGEIFYEYNFNTPHIIEVDPLYLHVAFTDALRYRTIEMYQEIRPEDEEPKTPLVIGHGWSNCSIIMPIIDRHRNCYSRDD